MKWLVPLLAAATLLPGCERAPAEPAVSVERAVVTVPAVPGAPGAAYFTLVTNHDPSRLVSVSSPSVQRIELHETRDENGRTAMRPLTQDGASFSPSEPLRFAPGGKHAMLMGVDPNLRPSGKVILRFQVEPLPQPIIVEAEVRGPDQARSEH